MIESDNILDILDWLLPRMKEYEQDRMLKDLGFMNMAGLIKCWIVPEVKERVKQEVAKRTSVKDCSFELKETPKKPVVVKKKFVPRTFIDMSSKDD